MKNIFLCIVVLVTYACSKEEARLDLIKNEGKSISLSCQKGEEVMLYVDVDMDFNSQPDMVMDFEFYKGNKLIQKGGIDPLVGIADEMEMRNTTGLINAKFYTKLQGSFIPQEDTIYKIKPTLIYNQDPDLKINTFELVIVR